MSFALNEIEATAKKAARGASYSWGLAEEAAKATRWMCAQGLDGCGVLARLLERGYAGDLAAHVPASLQGEWHGQEALCALTVGAFLSDSATLLFKGPITMKSVSEPAMVLPFAAMVARRLGQPVALTCAGVSAVTDGKALHLDGEVPQDAFEIHISAGSAVESSQTLQTRALPDDEAWATLNRFAHLTYAPATEESRRLGAGAGLSDND